MLEVFTQEHGSMEEYPNPYRHTDNVIAQCEEADDLDKSDIFRTNFLDNLILAGFDVPRL